MNSSFFDGLSFGPLSPRVFSLFRPVEEELGSKQASIVQTYRLLSLLSAVLLLIFGFLREASRPGAVDLWWVRLGVTGLFGALFFASFLSRQILQQYIRCTWGVIYVVMAWTVLLVALNNFSGDYAVGLVTVYAMLTAVIGLGARSIHPVLWFLTYGLFLTAVGIFVGPEPKISTPILLACMGVVALTEGVVVKGGLSTREKLREREAHIRGLANSLPGVVYQFYARSDGTYGLYFVSEHAEKVLGISADPDGFYERFLERVPESHREALVESIGQVVDDKAPWRFEIPFVKPSGERIWVLGTSTPEEREEELVFNGVLLNITERKEAEQALREERDRFETLFESLPTPVVRCEVREEGAFITAVNSAFEEVFGIEASTASGKDIDDLLVSEVHPKQAVEVDHRALQTGRTQTEVRSDTPSGERIFYLQISGRVPEKGPPELHAIYTDVTERRRMQERLLEVQQEERRRIDQEIHDEMGGLLTSLQMTVDLARRQVQETGLPTGPLDRIENLVSELSTAARTVSRKIYPRTLSDYGLEGALPPLAEEMKKQHGLEVDLQSELEKGERFSSLVERTAYWIVQEALVNVALHAEVEEANVVVNKRENQLSLRVSDQGSGFDPSAQSGEKSFGLEGIRRRVERLSGEVEIDAVPGQGTRISVILPHAPPLS